MYFSWAIIYVNLDKSSPQVHVSSGARAVAYISYAFSKTVYNDVRTMRKRPARLPRGEPTIVGFLSRSKVSRSFSYVQYTDSARHALQGSLVGLSRTLCTLYIYSLNERSNPPRRLYGRVSRMSARTINSYRESNAIGQLTVTSSRWAAVKWQGCVAFTRDL